jgi:shikimate kinase
MKIILIGMKGCGKTTIGTLLAERLLIPFIDSDTEIERMHKCDTGEAIHFRQIFAKYGEKYFHALEAKTLKHIAQEFANTDFVFACGGRTPLQEENQEVLLGLGKIIFLNVEKGVLLKRILAQGIPAFFPYQDNPEKSLDELLMGRVPVYKKLADITIDISKETPEKIISTILRELRELEAYDQN